MKYNLLLKKNKKSKNNINKNITNPKKNINEKL